MASPDQELPRRSSAEVVAGPALGLPSPQMTYASGRRSRPAAAPAMAGKHHKQPAAQAVAGRRSESGAGWEEAAPLPADADEPAPLQPPQPPIILPSSAAAVRVKEQQLGGLQGMPEDEEEELDTVADDFTTAEQPQGPGLLQKAVEASSAAAQAAVGLAGQAYAAAVPAVLSVVGQGPSETPAGEEGVSKAPASGQEEHASAPAGSGGHPATVQGEGALLQRPAVPSPSERAKVAAAAASAAGPNPATASLLPASAGTPAATGHGYFPTVGAVALAPKPAPRQSGHMSRTSLIICCSWLCDSMAFRLSQPLNFCAPPRWCRRTGGAAGGGPAHLWPADACNQPRTLHSRPARWRGGR
jgi:hypothetical protein